eukprot:TRINITY_DN11676_c0_g1_i1.p1 TRINITY_DN11676_c0_g1~~TRINITY_DN11676_c0_g1_i1.p1  ORF type:complete len:113 (+),score=13.62 TRINITY_DN11676_c0_g1_i1:113-451(+)
MNQGPPAAVDPSLNAFDGGAMGYNLGQIHFIRAITAIAAGISAGTLGLVFLWGFAYYAVVSTALSAVLFGSHGRHHDKYFPSVSGLVWEGVTKNMFTYVLFWTIAYGMVHVY